MSLKDWKKWAEHESSSGMGWFAEYSNKNDRYSYVKAWETGLSSTERKRRGINKFFVEGRIGINGITTKKNFKSKSQAIRYARNYMRKH